MYKPDTYWRERKDPNRKEWLSWKEWAWIRSALLPEDHIVEIGPGKGRCFPAYMYSSVVYGVDFVDTYAASAKQRAAECHLNYHHRILPDPEKVMESFPQCDVGIAVKMLQHVPHEDIFMWMDFLALCERIVIISDLTLTRPKHMFNHNYIDLLLDRDFVIEEYEPDGTRIYIGARHASPNTR